MIILRFSKGTEYIYTYMYISEEIYYEDLEAEKSHSLLTASWSPRRADGINCSLIPKSWQPGVPVM